MSAGTVSSPNPIPVAEPLMVPRAGSVQPTEPPVTSAAFRRRFTISDFERLYDLGFLGPEERYELIDGDLIEMARVQPPHASAVNRLTRRLVLALQDRASVIVQNPIRLGEEIDTQPQPDVTLARFREDGYAARHPFPEDIFLAIEVMDSTHRLDRGPKLSKYAKAGIRETWLVDLPGALIEVFRRPIEGLYSQGLILRPGDSIAPEVFPELVLSVSEILGVPASEGES